MEANPRTEATASQRAFNWQKQPPAKKFGASHRHCYRVVFSGGIELEIMDCRTPGLARVLAIDYQRVEGRRSDTKIVRTEKRPGWSAATAIAELLVFAQGGRGRDKTPG